MSLARIDPRDRAAGDVDRGDALGREELGRLHAAAAALADDEAVVAGGELGDVGRGPRRAGSAPHRARELLRTRRAGGRRDSGEPEARSSSSSSTSISRTGIASPRALVERQGRTDRAGAIQTRSRRSLGHPARRRCSRSRCRRSRRGLAAALAVVARPRRPGRRGTRRRCWAWYGETIRWRPPCWRSRFQPRSSITSPTPPMSSVGVGGPELEHATGRDRSVTAQPVDGVDAGARSGRVASRTCLGQAQVAVQRRGG